MGETLESLQRKMGAAEQVGTVVRTMKAMAASGIHQYEMAVHSLRDYYRTVALGIAACFSREGIAVLPEEQKQKEERVTGVIVIGSDIGLVGQFNDRLADFAIQALHAFKGRKEIWSVGERMQLCFKDAGFAAAKLFVVPNSVNAITPLVGRILMESEQSREKAGLKELYIFHNRPKQGGGYEQVSQRLFPLDEKGKQGLEVPGWSTKNLPQIIGDVKPVLSALIREYLFISLFRSCAESLASENAGRLEAMQRAEKKINELVDGFSRQFNRMRQEAIDEELFDVISGFEAFQKRYTKTG